jgi:lysophospholipase L1-like esterase
MLRLLTILISASMLLETAVFAAEPAVKREDIEWTNIWSPDLSKSDLPRVLLIGDSICNAYQSLVRENLKGKAYVAMVATSGALQDPAYRTQIELLVKNYKFDVIHFNNGLHGFDYTEEEYARDFPALVKIFRDNAPKAKLIWATSTPMRKAAPNLREFAPDNERVKVRNKAVKKLAAKEGIPVNDLFVLVENHPEYWSNDGTHYNAAGQAVEAEQVTRFVLEALSK